MSRSHLAVFISAGITAGLLFSFSARAEDRVAVADFSSAAAGSGVPAGWELKEKSGRADFAVVKDGDISAVRFRSNNTSFSLQKRNNGRPQAVPAAHVEMEGHEAADGRRFQKIRDR